MDRNYQEFFGKVMDDASVPDGVKQFLKERAGGNCGWPDPLLGTKFGGRKTFAEEFRDMWGQTEERYLNRINTLISKGRDGEDPYKIEAQKIVYEEDVEKYGAWNKQKGCLMR
ncbi:hypothetical protein HDU76_003988 [Blyttiomyces sp. JEL0837]|nr:hypothetical protein HDU76_003988 [Blyttiomyces sp. JEL0837]